MGEVCSIASVEQMPLDLSGQRGFQFDDWLLGALCFKIQTEVLLVKKAFSLQLYRSTNSATEIGSTFPVIVI